MIQTTKVSPYKYGLVTLVTLPLQNQGSPYLSTADSISGGSTK